ncbi:hypothetical protein BC833DRAFT_571961 [Globomyces pollinis-pini]|nr:hypothetical protein BC833DRAFT_571961 [Globomyces pollinis-pini]
MKLLKLAVLIRIVFSSCKDDCKNAWNDGTTFSVNCGSEQRCLECKEKIVASPKWGDCKDSMVYYQGHATVLNAVGKLEPL